MKLKFILPTLSLVFTTTYAANLNLHSYSGAAMYSENIHALQTTMPPNARLSNLPQIVHLLGVRSNAFEIRDDILEYILATIPADNVAAINAAIRFAQYDQQILYNPNPDHQREYYAWLGNTISCLGAFIDRDTKLQMINDIAKLYRNTPERSEWAHKVESEVLGGRISAGSTGLISKRGYNINIIDYCRSGKPYWK